jgi:hexosaminidase
MKLMLLTVTVCVLGLWSEAMARDGEVTLVPVPAEVAVDQGHFRFSEHTRIVVDGGAEVERLGSYFADLIEHGTGIAIAVERPDKPGLPAGTILLSTSATDPTLGAEGYELTITPSAIVVRAPEAAGVFYALQTIRQLLPPELAQPEQTAGQDVLWRVPCVRITDQPRYSWRGSLLDCGRHFMDKEFVKRYIDLLAYHKMNVLHWHLTEDQGWRIEISQYPELTEIGAWRGEERYGGFYTKDDVREIIAYAQDRYVTIVPEIEMPGHAQGALAAFANLSCTGGPFEVSTRWGVHREVYCAGNDEVFTFLENVLAEVFELFPSEYIHIGGDECPKTRWEACPKCQQRIEDEGLANEHELQSYFIRRMEAFINENGRNLIGWDEILEGGLAPNATVQSWRGMDGAIAAAKSGHDVIASPRSHCYLDYPQSADAARLGYMGVITLEQIYSFEPTPEELTGAEAAHILGAEGNVWTEHIPQDRVDVMTYPRLAALAEVTWSPKAKRDWADFQTRIDDHERRLDALGVKYYVDPPSCAPAVGAFEETLTLTLFSPRQDAEIRYTRDGSDPITSPHVFGQPLTLHDSTTIKAVTVLPNGRVSEPIERRFRKIGPKLPLEVRGAEVGLAYRYYEGDWNKLPDFDALTPVRSGVAAVVSADLDHVEDRFGFVFEGYLNVAEPGVYTFYLTSDDGSCLLVAGEDVIDHDGLHGPSTKSGEIALEAGLHTIRVDFFEQGGGQRLDLDYSGPGIERMPVSGAQLFHGGEIRETTS